ncbi:acyl-CoA dehydrogenase NM domain-like protein [Pholiota conissans]|uniref:Acyl-CoA dehydrogenase NM domain-like protein n=1 Tax=Pholiota conissans TaxID=109636 RepID=A0A9P5YZ69_9AGAR|nr:acyl-CoA dehydrogenase NM domain-like protein [Pholiota conissans]
MSSRTALLAQSPLFKVVSAHLPHDERVQLSYKRAIAIGRAYQLTADDIVNTTPKFWELQRDPIIPMDGAAGTLLSIHLNLCIGTFARYAVSRPDMTSALNRLLNFELFDLSGQFCLTEIGHGLDARHLETTATVLADGSIDLHTPNERAAKHMPPTSPCGIPTMAVVFARLLVNGEDRGIRPFSVLLHDGYNMNQGITCKLMTPRGSSVPVNHCLTYFNHVRLPSTALIAHSEKGQDTRHDFFDHVYRIIVGAIAIAGMCLSSIKMGLYVAARYSQRRMVTDAFNGKLTPILSFPTQQYPILSTLAQSVVFESFIKDTLRLFNDKSLSLTMHHCVAAIAKATLVKHCAASLITLGDRCGAQGIFEVNQFSVQYADLRGAAIAEGEVLGLSVRFAVEILIGRIKLPKSRYPDSLLSRHETSIFQELRGALSTRFKHHRDPEFQALVLPQCQALIEAVGHRMAYDAAIADGVDERVLDMFVASAIREDRAWYAEVGGVSRAEQVELERKAMKALLPCLDALLEGLQIEKYCHAPIISEERWQRYVDGLPTFMSVDAPTSDSYDRQLIRAML